MMQNNELKPEDITIETIQQNLATSFMPNPDLLIRTGGEYRLSNYLLWQCAYSELYFSDVFWPVFGQEEYYKSLSNYQKPARRSGKTLEKIS